MIHDIGCEWKERVEARARIAIIESLLPTWLCLPVVTSSYHFPWHSLLFIIKLTVSPSYASARAITCPPGYLPGQYPIPLFICRLISHFLLVCRDHILPAYSFLGITSRRLFICRDQFPR